MCQAHPCPADRVGRRIVEAQGLPVEVFRQSEDGSECPRPVDETKRRIGPLEAVVPGKYAGTVAQVESPGNTRQQAVDLALIIGRITHHIDGIRGC